jgi:hypothetical protein
MNEFNSPFYVSLIDSYQGNYKFIVNAGDINSFIFSTYKAKYKSIIRWNENMLKVDERDYYAVNLQKERSFKFGDFWQPTFTINDSCNVYLTIPKVPQGFNDTYSNFMAFQRLHWWLGNYPLDFLNQFKIVTSIDENFYEDLNKNTITTDKNSKFWYNGNLTGKTQFLDDAEYPGKIYIKLARIEINDGKVSIENFFNSEVISPTRFIRYGNTRLLNEKYIVRIAGKSNLLFVDESLDFNSPNILPKTNNNDPSLFINDVDGAFSFYTFRADPDNSNTYYLRPPNIYQIIKVSKTELGGKLKIENFFEDVSLRNSILNIIREEGYNGSENLRRPMSEAGAISFVFNGLGLELDPFVDDIIEDENPEEEEGGSASQEESSTNADEGELLEEVISEGDAYPDINLIKNFVELIGFTP